MTRFMGVALAIVLACGCAAKSKDEPRGGAVSSADNPHLDDTSAGSANNNPVATMPDKQPEGQAKPGFVGAPDTHQQASDSGGGPKTGGEKPLDPSANADPNSPKQQARTTGLLGASDGFDDSPVDLQFDTPDDAIKTLLAQQKAGLTACHKTGGGMLEVSITVNAMGKVTGVKIEAASTLKDAKARACVVSELKKLKLDKGTKPTGSIKLNFPK